MDLRTKTFREMVGTTILDRYEIQELLGAGGMGAVFRGIQKVVNRTVAIKVLPKLDPLTAARFHREAKTASRLSHPNTITVFDFGQTQEGFLFLVMEYLEGRTLGDALKEMGALPPRRAVHIANQICRSLAEAHAAGIVHRDIKPDNIFLIHRNDDPDFIKVLDFGIAKVMAGDDSDDDLTQQGRIVGTPRYMAPEQVLGLPIDHRADIYSLGCILYQMLTGSPPFDDSSTAMLMMKHAHEQPAEFMYRLPEVSTESIPVGLEAVVMKALCKRPEERQQTVDMLRTEFELVLPMGGGFSSQSMSQPMLRRSSSVAPVSRRYSQPPMGPNTPGGAMSHQVRDPSNPSGSNPSLSHPALMPRGGVPTGSGAWPVTVNQPHTVSQSQQPVTPPQGSPTPHPATPMPSGRMLAITPPGASASGDYSGEVWPPPNRNRVVIVAILGTLLVVLLILTALAAGFFIGQPDTQMAEGKQSSATGADDGKADDRNAQAHAQNRHARITIRTEPTGATIFNNDRPVGETPMVIDVSDEENEVRYTVKLEGHQSVTRRFVVSTISPGGEEWDIELDKLGQEPIAENDEDDEPAVEIEEKKTVQANPTRNNKRNTRAASARKNKASTQGKTDDKKDSKPVAENPPANDNASAAKEDKGAAKKDNKPRKPKVNALDGGGTKKPKVNALDGGGTKKPKVNALDSGKPKVKALE